MDFATILDEVAPGEALNPFAARDENGNWVAGTIGIAWLNEHFGSYTTADEMIAATESEGLKQFFAWLRDQGKLN